MRHSFVATAALALSLFAFACGGGAGDDAAASDEAETAQLAWHSESDVADATAYKTVLTYFDAHAVRGSFVSDHPKVHTTRQGPQVDIAYAIVRAKNERGAVVVVNGRTESFSHYAELVYDLNRRGYTLYMLDHRGQGHSSRLLDYETVGDHDYQKGHVDDFQDYVSDLAKFVDTVVKPDRVGKPAKLFALGHSLGGAVTTLYAEQHPDTFAGIALSSPMHQLQASTFLVDVAKAGALLFATSYAIGKGPRDDNEPFEGNELTGSRARFEAKRSVWNGDPATKIGGPTFGWVSRSASATDTVQRAASKIGAPVLLMEAGADKIVAPEGQHKVCDAINAASSNVPTPRCQLVVVDGSHHEGLIEIDPIRQRELDLVVRFYDQHR